MTVLDPALIADDAALLALEPAWARLWARCPDATPFQHPAWVLPCWQVFGTGRPRVAVLRDEGGELLGLLPLYGLLEEGKVLPIGAGLADYVDALIAPDAPRDAAATLLHTALRGCDLPCHLPDLPPGAALRDARPLPGWQAETLETEPCPVLTIGHTPARQLRKLRMSRHRADRIGGWWISDAPTATLFDHLIRLHGARWTARGEAGVLADAHVQSFHRIALPRLDEAGLLRLRALELGGRIAAVIYALTSPSRIYCYLGGFDADFAFESPGTLLLGAMLEEAAGEGIVECHFLRGGEAYKYAWGAADRINALRVLAPP